MEATRHAYACVAARRFAAAGRGGARVPPRPTPARLRASPERRLLKCSDWVRSVQAEWSKT